MGKVCIQLFFFQLWLNNTGFFNLSMATSLGKGKLWIQTSCRPREKWALPSYSCSRHPIGIALITNQKIGLGISDWWWPTAFFIPIGIQVAILFLFEQYKILLLSNKAALSLDCYFAIVYICLSHLWLANLLLLLMGKFGVIRWNFPPFLKEIHVKIKKKMWINFFF